jgi:hypothetical protein
MPAPKDVALLVATGACLLIGLIPGGGGARHREAIIDHRRGPRAYPDVLTERQASVDHTNGT